MPEPAVYAHYLLRYVVVENKYLTTNIDYIYISTEYWVFFSIELFRFPPKWKICIVFLGGLLGLLGGWFCCLLLSVLGFCLVGLEILKTIFERIYLNLPFIVFV